MSKVIEQEHKYIISRVEKEYPNEKAFYNGKLSQMTWTRLKKGESSFRNLTRRTWELIVEALFTDYEYTIFKQAKRNMQLNLVDNLEKEYNRLRIQHALYMINNGAYATVDSSQWVVSGEEPNRGTQLKIEDELGNTIIFSINVPSHQVPSGRKNRLDWINKNLNEDILN